MFSFYGAKRRLAALYPSPAYDTIVEPFCGSAAYSLHGDHWQKNVWLYDIDKRIVAVWEYLISATEKDIMGLPMFGRGVNTDSFEQLSQAERWFLGYMISAATRNPKKTATEKTNWNERSQKKIALAVSKIKHWHVACGDFRQIMNREATWFVDPPYQIEGKWYDFKLKPEDYSDLATKVGWWWGEVVVCDTIEADWLPFKPLIENKGQSNNKKIEGIYVR